MTSAWARSMMRLPRRWDGGSPAGPRLSAGAGGCSPIPRPAWRPDRPSAGLGSDPLRQGRSTVLGVDARGLTPVPSTHARGQGGTDRGEACPPIPRAAWWPGRPSVGRPSEAGRAGRPLRPTGLGHGRRARAWTPCLSSPSPRADPLPRGSWHWRVIRRPRTRNGISVSNQLLAVPQFSLATGSNWCITRARRHAALTPCARHHEAA
jgi:hypothetical protein